jgi:hypothetical protein
MAASTALENLPVEARGIASGALQQGIYDTSRLMCSMPIVISRLRCGLPPCSLRQLDACPGDQSEMAKLVFHCGWNITICCLDSGDLT